MISMSELPLWLVAVCWASLAVALASAAFLAFDVWRRPQPMTVMNLVWPICALFGSVVWVAAYLAWGRAPLRDRRTGAAMPAMDMSGGEMAGMAMHAERTAGADTGGMDMSGMDMSGGHMHMAPLGMSTKPRTMGASVYVGTSHYGACCSLADLIVEWVVFAVPVVAIVGGMDWLFHDALYATWVLAYIMALIIGIGFQ